MKSNKKVYFQIFFTNPAKIDILLKCSSHVWSALARCTLIRVLGWPPPPITRFGKRSGLPAPSSMSGRRQSFHPAKIPWPRLCLLFPLRHAEEGTGGPDLLRGWVQDEVGEGRSQDTDQRQLCRDLLEVAVLLQKVCLHWGWYVKKKIFIKKIFITFAFSVYLPTVLCS